MVGDFSLKRATESAPCKKEKLRLLSTKNLHDFLDRIPIARGDQPSVRAGLALRRRLGKPVKR